MFLGELEMWHVSPENSLLVQIRLSIRLILTARMKPHPVKTRPSEKLFRSLWGTYLYELKPVPFKPTRCRKAKDRAHASISALCWSGRYFSSTP